MKKTHLYRAPVTEEQICRSAQILKNGGLVVFPTETVYGLGANALDIKASQSIFQAKGRPADNPLIVHIADFSMLETVATHIPETARILFELFSPGPLTLILPKRLEVPDCVTAGLTSVAVRIPAHPLARKLIEKAGIPIAAPSANQSGRPSPTSFIYACAEMDDRVDAIIDGGDCSIGLESTVLSLTDKTARILRPGAVTESAIREALNGTGTTLDTIPAQPAERPQSPGMKYAHYRPKAEVLLVQDWTDVDTEKLFPGKKIGVMALKTNGEFPKAETVFFYSNLEDYAYGLYRGFFDMDTAEADIILAETVPEEGIGSAIMNRLRKSAGGSI